MMEFGFKVRRADKQSIIHHLRDRETFISRPNTHHHVARKFYCNILPNYTLIDVEKPPCFLRKFSPDGKYFVAFSADQASLEVYEFQGKYSLSYSILTPVCLILYLLLYVLFYTYSCLSYSILTPVCLILYLLLHILFYTYSS